MEFKDFAERLYNVIGGENTHSFARTMFEYVVNDDGLEILEDIPSNTYKAYFNGSVGISRIAKKILQYPNENGFKEYISGLDTAIRRDLADAFIDIFPDANSKNIAKKLASLFNEILKTAATTKRKSPAKKKKKAEAPESKPVIEPISTTSSEQLIAVQSFSKKYYQLLVTTEPDIFETNIISMPTSRALTQGIVPDEIFQRCSSLSDAGKSELMTFPAIICQENTEMNGITDPNQRAVYGYLRKIQKSGKNIKILFVPLASFKQQLLCDKKNALFFDLRMDCAITELNHTAWSVHETDLFEAFEEAGITDIPKPE